MTSPEDLPLRNGEDSGNTDNGVTRELGQKTLKGDDYSANMKRLDDLNKDLAEFNRAKKFEDYKKSIREAAMAGDVALVAELVTRHEAETNAEYSEAVEMEYTDEDFTETDDAEETEPSGPAESAEAGENEPDTVEGTVKKYNKSRAVKIALITSIATALATVVTIVAVNIGGSKSSGGGSPSTPEPTPTTVTAPEAPKIPVAVGEKEFQPNTPVGEKSDVPYVSEEEKAPAKADSKKDDSKKDDNEKDDNKKDDSKKDDNEKDDNKKDDSKKDDSKKDDNEKDKPAKGDDKKEDKPTEDNNKRGETPTTDDSNNEQPVITPTPETSVITPAPPSTENPIPSEIPIETVTPAPEWGKTSDPHGGTNVTPSDFVSPETKVTKEENDTTNQNNQGYVDDHRAAPGSASENNGVVTDATPFVETEPKVGVGFAESGITASNANNSGEGEFGQRIYGNENQATNEQGNAEVAGTNTYHNEEANEIGQAIDQAGNNAQEIARGPSFSIPEASQPTPEVEVGQDNYTNEAEEAAVASEDF